MPVSMKSLGLDQLSVAERILLTEELWDSIEKETNQTRLTEGNTGSLANSIS
jgi:putative addiction module component (TIGR02574 family)